MSTPRRRPPLTHKVWSAGSDPYFENQKTAFGTKLRFYSSQARTIQETWTLRSIKSAEYRK